MGRVCVCVTDSLKVVVDGRVDGYRASCKVGGDGNKQYLEKGGKYLTRHTAKDRKKRVPATLHRYDDSFNTTVQNDIHEEGVSGLESSAVISSVGSSSCLDHGNNHTTRHGTKIEQKICGSAGESQISRRQHLALSSDWSSHRLCSTHGSLSKKLNRKRTIWTLPK